MEFVINEEITGSKTEIDFCQIEHQVVWKKSTDQSLSNYAVELLPARLSISLLLLFLASIFYFKGIREKD